MSSLEKITHRKTHSAGVYESLLNSRYLADLPLDYIGPTGLTRNDLFEKVQRLKDCCNSIDIAEMTSGNIKIHKANFCKQHIVCGPCANRIQNLRRKRLTPAIKAAATRADPQYHGDDKLYGYFVTYTIPDGSQILETHLRLKEAMRNFRRLGQRRKRKDGSIYHSGGEYGKVIGGCGTHENIQGAAGGVHSHCHMIYFTDRPLDFTVYKQKEKADLVRIYGKNNIPREKLEQIKINDEGYSKISWEWHISAGDAKNFKVIPLRRIPQTGSPETIAACAKMNFADSVTYQAREVIKYAAKIESNSGDFAAAMLNETHNKRMFESAGIFRGLSDDNNFDESEIDQGDHVAGFYRISWDNETKQYTQKRAIDDPGIDIGGNQGRYALYKYLQNQLIGDYRRQRAEMIRAGLGAAALDGWKAICREKIKLLWENYKKKENQPMAAWAAVHSFVRHDISMIDFSYSNFQFLRRSPAYWTLERDRCRSYLNKKLYSVQYSQVQKLQESADPF